MLEWNSAKFSRSNNTAVQHGYLAFAPVNGTNKRVRGISILPLAGLGSGLMH